MAGTSKVILIGDVAVEVSESPVDPNEVDSAAAESSKSSAQSIYNEMSEEAKALFDPNKIGLDEISRRLNDANQGTAGSEELTDSLNETHEFYFYRVTGETTTRPTESGGSTARYPGVPSNGGADPQTGEERVAAPGMRAFEERRPVLRVIRRDPDKAAEKGETLTQTFATSDFFLRTVSEQHQEKYQIFETFGDPIVYFFGSRPRIFTYTGIMFNAKSLNWANNFTQDYERELRGTQAARNLARVLISYDQKIDEGYLLGLSIQRDAVANNGAAFSLTMLVTNVNFIGGLGDEGERPEGGDPFSWSQTEDILTDVDPMRAQSLEELDASMRGVGVPAGNAGTRLVSERYIKSNSPGVGMIGFVAAQKDAARPGELSVTFSDPLRLTSGEFVALESLAAEAPDGLITVPRPSWAPGRRGSIRRIVLMDSRKTATDASILSGFAGGSGGVSPHYYICRGGSVHPNTGSELKDGQIIQLVQETHTATVLKNLSSGQGRSLPGAGGTSGLEGTALDGANITDPTRILNASDIQGANTSREHFSLHVGGSGTQTGHPLFDVRELGDTGIIKEIFQVTISASGKLSSDDVGNSGGVFHQIVGAHLALLSLGPALGTVVGGVLVGDALSNSFDSQQVRSLVKSSLGAEIADAIARGRMSRVTTESGEPGYGGYAMISRATTTTLLQSTTDKGFAQKVAKKALAWAHSSWGSARYTVEGKSLEYRALMNIMTALMFQESSYNPYAVSPDLAAGFPQFLQPWGKHSGLRIELPNGGNAAPRRSSFPGYRRQYLTTSGSDKRVHIDDRFDPVRAVQAAYKWYLEMIKEQTSTNSRMPPAASLPDLAMFALAAYNAGSPAVYRAREKATAAGDGGQLAGRTFKSIEKYLPSEAQDYVNRITALIMKADPNPNLEGGDPVGQTNVVKPGDPEPIQNVDDTAIYVMLNGPAGGNAPYTQKQIDSACLLIKNIVARRGSILSSGRENGLVGRKHVGGVKIEGGQEVLRFKDPVTELGARAGFDFSDGGCIPAALASEALNEDSTFVGSWGKWWDEGDSQAQQIPGNDPVGGYAPGLTNPDV